MTRRGVLRAAASVVAGGLLLGIVTMPGDTVTFAQPRKEPASKIAHVITERLARIESARAGGVLTAQAALSLSDRLLQVTGDGQFEVEFHATSRATGDQADALRGFGATILNSTADAVWPAGTAPPPNLGIITVTNTGRSDPSRGRARVGGRRASGRENPSGRRHFPE